MKALMEATSKLKPYYDIDKIKAFAVYVWTKGEEGFNVFDIMADRIIFYDEEHQIIEEAKPIIEEIQENLKRLQGV